MRQNSCPRLSPFDGALWTELEGARPKHASAHSAPDQMPGMSPLDPRQVAVFDLRQRLSEVLGQSTFTDRPAPSAKTRLCVAETKVVRGSARTVISFDPSVGMLPIETVSYSQDSTVSRHTPCLIERLTREMLGCWMRP